jgi:hypothetical protein
MDEEKYIQGIEKTGFELEYKTADILMKNGWTVISNKYYIDDVQGSAREIDIIAYKVSTEKDVQIYTVLIISCKKSLEKAWVLLSKEKNEKDPNVDWTPITLWSNNPIIRLIINKFNWKDKYINSSKKLKESLFLPFKHIFAFQEIDIKKGSPQNDKAIFDSIVSSMKSQDYEINSLELRKKQEAVYNFNLLSIVDAPLYRIDYGASEKTIESIDSEIYISNYIINKKEVTSRINFIKFDNFQDCLRRYNALHLHNISYIEEFFNIYYKDCLKNQDKVNLLIEDFRHLVRWDIYSFLKKKFKIDYNDTKSIHIVWSSSDNSVILYINNMSDEDIINELNENEVIKSKISSALKETYQYEGAFSFEIDIPF